MLPALAKARAVQAAEQAAESIARVEAKLDRVETLLASIVDRLDRLDPRPATTRKDR